MDWIKDLNGMNQAGMGAVLRRKHDVIVRNSRPNGRRIAVGRGKGEGAAIQLVCRLARQAGG